MIRSSPFAGWLLLPAAFLMAAPFAVLLWETPWTSFSLAYGDLRAVWISISCGLLALGLIAVLGTPLALWLARSRSSLTSAVEILVLMTVATPPLAMGILLVSVYGPYGGIGEVLGRISISLNNNTAAFTLAQFYGGIGYYVLAARNAFESVGRPMEQAALSLGAAPWQSFRRVILPMASRGLLGALVIAWVRLIGEFGIVMVFAYFPQGIPVKLYIHLQDDGLSAVYALLWILLLTTLPMPLLNLLSPRRP